MSKSTCWIDGKECPYQSNIRCIKDVSLSCCSTCNRFQDEIDLITNFVGEHCGGEWVEYERLGIMYSLLKLLKQYERFLCLKDLKNLKSILISE